MNCIGIPALDTLLAKIVIQIKTFLAGAWDGASQQLDIPRAITFFILVIAKKDILMHAVKCVGFFFATT